MFRRIWECAFPSVQMGVWSQWPSSDDAEIPFDVLSPDLGSRVNRKGTTLAETAGGAPSSLAKRITCLVIGGGLLIGLAVYCAPMLMPILLSQSIARVAVFAVGIALSSYVIGRLARGALDWYYEADKRKLQPLMKKWNQLDPNQVGYPALRGKLLQEIATIVRTPRVTTKRTQRMPYLVIPIATSMAVMCLAPTLFVPMGMAFLGLALPAGATLLGKAVCVITSGAFLGLAPAALPIALSPGNPEGWDDVRRGFSQDLNDALSEVS